MTESISTNAIDTITRENDYADLLKACQRNPRPCVDCGEPTMMWDEEKAMAFATSCRCQRRQMRHRAFLDNGIPEAYLDTDLGEYVEHADSLVESRVQRLLQIRDRYIAQLPRLMADDGAQQRIKAMVNGKEKCFNSLVVHLDVIEAARHFATDIAKATLGPKIAYYSFAEIVNVLGDFSRTEELRELTTMFRNIALLVVDGVERGRYNDHVIQRWSALITQRSFSGRPTVVVAFDDPKSAITSRQWYSFVDDALLVASTLRAGVEETTFAEPLQPARTAIASATLADKDAVEEAILQFIARAGTPVFSKIADGVNADKALIGKVLDSLVAEGELEKAEKAGKNGVFTVYQLKDEVPKSAPPASEKAPATDKKSLGELAKITGRGKTTIHRWREEGLSDSEIIQKAASGA